MKRQSSPRRAGGLTQSGSVVLVDRLVNEVDAEVGEDVGLQQRDERFDDVDEHGHAEARQRRQVAGRGPLLHAGEQEDQPESEGTPSDFDLHNSKQKS